MLHCRARQAAAESGKNRNPQYWQNLVGIIPSNHFQDWQRLLKALEKYRCEPSVHMLDMCDLLNSRSEILGGRAEAIRSVESVRRENAELKGLLQTYLQSKVSFDKSHHHHAERN